MSDGHHEDQPARIMDESSFEDRKFDETFPGEIERNRAGTREYQMTVTVQVSFQLTIVSRGPQIMNDHDYETLQHEAATSAIIRMQERSLDIINLDAGEDFDVHESQIKVNIGLN